MLWARATAIIVNDNAAQTADYRPNVAENTMVGPVVNVTDYTCYLF